MNLKDKIKGKVNEAVGETREHLGRAIGNQDMESKGHQQEMRGKLQQLDADDVAASSCSSCSTETKYSSTPQDG